MADLRDHGRLVFTMVAQTMRKVCNADVNVSPMLGPPLFYPAQPFASNALTPLQTDLERMRTRAGRIGRCRGWASASHCGIEWDEWLLVTALLSADDAVLEFGARYGTTSCVLARATQNSGMVVSVEPDARAVPALLQNSRRHNCSVNIVNGTVSDQPMVLSPQRGKPYGTRTRMASGGEQVGRVSRLDAADIQRHLGQRFSALLIE